MTTISIIEISIGAIIIAANLWLWRRQRDKVALWVAIVLALCLGMLQAVRWGMR